MPYIDREGVEIYYHVSGSGPPILLSHGFTSSSHMWQRQVEHLEDRYQVITWDFRGHGRSSSPEDLAEYTEAKTTGDMLAVLEACGVGRAVIGGLSLGGYMSLAFHLAHPQRVRALVLCDTGPGYKNDAARQGWNENALRRAEQLDSDGFAALSRSSEVQATRHRGAEGLARAARGMLRQFDARVIESLPHIAVPTLVVVGAQDQPFLVAADYMTRKIPAATKAVIEDAGHGVNLDQPEAFNGVLDDFLGGLVPP